MADWTASMQQTFEYYSVDPGTWKDVKLIDNITGCTISRDVDADTLGSATLDINDAIGEQYIREYLVTIQNGVKERHPLGTHMIQSPSTSFDGKITSVSMDAYTPLIELKESPPPIGYSLLKDQNIMDIAYRLVREHARAPVVSTTDEQTLYSDFVSDLNDTWLTFLKDLISNAKYNFSLDEHGRILFAPVQDIASLQPKWTFDDGNSSILYPSISMDRDLYGVPNVVEVIYSKGYDTYTATAVNNDPNSPISTISRGRKIVYRETDPDLIGNPTKKQIDKYAEQLLRNLSAVEYTISYTHGYCPVTINDCVRLNYERAGITDVKAKIISQTINCTPGCPVTETAVFTKNLWG